MLKLRIKVPKLDESITKGTIISWSIKIGDMIQGDDVFFEVNTAKVSAEILSPAIEKVVETLYKKGDAVAVGTVVAIIGLNGEELPGTKPINIFETSSPLAGAVGDEPANTASKPVIAGEEHWYSPVVTQLTREAKIPEEGLGVIQGIGYEGRLSRKDIEDYIEGKGGGGSVESKPILVVVAPVVSETSVVVSSEQASPRVVPIAMPGVEVKEMDCVRRIITNHMAMSKKVPPHVTNIVEIDVTKLVYWRRKNKDAFFRRGGVRLTYMPVVMGAMAKALVAYPRVNVPVDRYNILLRKHINVDIVVSLNDGNLIVLVMHDADHLNLNGLAIAIDSLALKARDNKLMPEDTDGGTFTITNFGAFKSLSGTPIINQPQVATLGVGYVEKKPAVVETPEGDIIATWHKMYLSLPYDRRVVDGMLGDNFLHSIADYLESWKS